MTASARAVARGSRTRACRSRRRRRRSCPTSTTASLRGRATPRTSPRSAGRATRAPPRARRRASCAARPAARARARPARSMSAVVARPRRFHQRHEAVTRGGQHSGRELFDLAEDGAAIAVRGLVRADRVELVVGESGEPLDDLRRRQRVVAGDREIVGLRPRRRRRPRRSTTSARTPTIGVPFGRAGAPAVDVCGARSPRSSPRARATARAQFGTASGRRRRRVIAADPVAQRLEPLGHASAAASARRRTRANCPMPRAFVTCCVDLLAAGASTSPAPARCTTRSAPALPRAHGAPAPSGAKTNTLDGAFDRVADAFGHAELVAGRQAELGAGSDAAAVTRSAVARRVYGRPPAPNDDERRRSRTIASSDAPDDPVAEPHVQRLPRCRGRLRLRGRVRSNRSVSAVYHDRSRR